MTEAFERKDVAAERYRSIEKALSDISDRLARIEATTQKIEVETRAELSMLKERVEGVRKTKLAPLGIGAAGGGVIAAIAEIAKRILS